MLLETATIHALETQENADLFFNDEETNQLKVDINGDGSIDEVEPLTVSEITSTNAYFSPENSLHITPNPVSDEVLIKLPDKEALNTTLTINIYNVNGIKVFNKIIANPSGNEINLSLSHLPAGVYILQIFDNETAYAAKLIIN
ncbi:MAG: T9SS type A sorting domain-containing protein [Bacteroidales bacterium]